MLESCLSLVKSVWLESLSDGLTDSESLADGLSDSDACEHEALSSDGAGDLVVSSFPAFSEVGACCTSTAPDVLTGLSTEDVLGLGFSFSSVAGFGCPLAFFLRGCCFPFCFPPPLSFAGGGGLLLASPLLRDFPGDKKGNASLNEMPS